jgi:hypothetical protein
MHLRPKEIAVQRIEIHADNPTGSEPAGADGSAEPQQPPSALRTATQVFSWVGIVGGAITLFTHFRDMITLSDWAQMLVMLWRGWATAFWQFGAGWLGFRVPPEYAILFSFAGFCLMTALAARRTQAEPELRDTAFYWKVFSYWMMSLFSYGIVLLSAVSFATRHRGFAAELVALLILVLTPSLLLIHLFRRQLAHAVTFATVFFIFTIVLLFKPTAQTLELMAARKAPAPHGHVSLIGVALGIYVLQYAMVAIAPLAALTRRVVLLGIALALLLGLNQLLLHAADIRLLLRSAL